MKVSEFSLCASHDRGGHVQVETLLVTFPSCSRLFSIDPRIFLPSRLECYEQANLLPTSGGARVASTATCVKSEFFAFFLSLFDKLADDLCIE